jgi:O-antigen ligase
MFSASIALTLLSLAVGYAIFGYGGVRWDVRGVSVALIGAGAAAWFAFSRSRRLQLPARPVLALAALTLGLGALQVVPLPVSWIRALSPARAALQEAARPVLGDSSWATLSAAPAASLDKLVTLTACLLIFLLLYHFTLEMETLAWLPVLPLATAGFLQAVLGLIQCYGGGAGAVAQGSFVNRNHFAGLLELCLPFPILWGAAILARRGSRYRSPATPSLLACLAFSVAAVILVAILFSLSRMGFIASLASLLVTGSLALAAHQPGVLRKLAPLAVLLIIGLAFVFLPNDQLIDRFASISSTAEISSDTRLQIWKDTLLLVREYPLFGCGLGAYEPVLLRYKTVAPDHTVDYAHNDYLQILAEFGVPGFALALAFLVVITASLTRTIFDAPGMEQRALPLACIGAVTALVLHSFVDFNLYVPSNAMVAAWIAGLSLGGPPRAWLD